MQKLKIWENFLGLSKMMKVCGTEVERTADGFYVIAEWILSAFPRCWLWEQPDSRKRIKELLKRQNWERKISFALCDMIYWCCLTTPWKVEKHFITTWNTFYHPRDTFYHQKGYILSPQMLFEHKVVIQDTFSQH